MLWIWVIKKLTGWEYADWRSRNDRYLSEITAFLFFALFSVGRAQRQQYLTECKSIETVGPTACLARNKYLVQYSSLPQYLLYNRLQAFTCGKLQFKSFSTFFKAFHKSVHALLPRVTFGANRPRRICRHSQDPVSQKARFVRQRARRTVSGGSIGSHRQCEEEEWRNLSTSVSRSPENCPKCLQHFLTAIWRGLLPIG